MSKKDDVLRAMVSDAMTLTYEDLEQAFDSTRYAMDRVMEERGMVGLTDEDWQYVRIFFTFFYQAGFSDSCRRFDDLLDRIIDAGNQTSGLTCKCTPLA